MRLTSEEKKLKAESMKVFLPDEVLDDKCVCIYGFFAVKNRKRECFYVGKTTNLNDRMLNSSDGHIYDFINGTYTKLVPELINKYRDEDYKIYVKVLEKVDYRDTSFSRAAHRLALAEYKWIVHYQEKEQCLDQMPEGIEKDGKEMKFWKKNYCIKE